MRVTSVIGVPEVQARLRAAKVKTAHDVARNLRRAGRYLQRQSQKVVPVDTGYLKNGAGTKQIGRDEHAVVAVYYTASYAVYVHERTDLRHKPGKIAKYLERPAKEHREDILRIIAGGEARVT